MAPHLVIFDVDGTLVDSMTAEAALFPAACCEALGLRDVSGDWNDYRNPTDRGIVEELVERRLGRDATATDFARVEARFLSLLADAQGNDEALLLEVPGAAAAFAEVRARPDTLVAIATAGWRSTALFKLQRIGIAAEDLPAATANDAGTKRDIMDLCHGRALRYARAASFATVTYVGDSSTDRRAAADLGFEFIGVDTSGWVATAARRVPNFADVHAFFKALDDAQASVRAGRSR